MAEDFGLGFDETPTYRTLAVFAFFVLFSWICEKGAHHAINHLERKGKLSLLKGFHAVVFEVALLGLLSLLLTSFGPLLASICVGDCKDRPCNVVFVMCPLQRAENPNSDEGNASTDENGVCEGIRCPSPDSESFVSAEALEQTHILLFLLAMTKVVSSIILIALTYLSAGSWSKHVRSNSLRLGLAKEFIFEKKVNPLDSTKKQSMNHSSSVKHGSRENFGGHSMSECETPGDKELGSSDDHNCSKSPSKLGDDETTLEKIHGHHNPDGLRIKDKLHLFLLQFYRPISKGDLIACRLAFINRHKLVSKFRFDEYLQRAMDANFAAYIAPTSPWLWVVAMLIIFICGIGTYDEFTMARIVFLWLIVPACILSTCIGYKIQVIMFEILRSVEGKSNHKNVPKRRKHFDGRDSLLLHLPPVQREEIRKQREFNFQHFWLGSPWFLFQLIALNVFLASFGVAWEIWVVWQLGVDSCVHGNYGWLLFGLTLFLSLLLYVHVGYCTLPSCSLVALMGPSYTYHIFSDEVRQNVKQWIHRAKRKRSGVVRGFPGRVRCSMPSCIVFKRRPRKEGAPSSSHPTLSKDRT